MVVTARTQARPDVDEVSACCATGLGAPLARPDADRLARVLKAAADPVRLQLLSIIRSRGEVCACDLVAPVGLAQPTVSHHLKVLAGAGLVLREQRGTWAWFRVNTERMRDLSALFGA